MKMTSSTNEKDFIAIATITILVLIGIVSVFSIISSKNAEEKRRKEQEANAARLAMQLLTVEDMQKIAYYSNLIKK